MLQNLQSIFLPLCSGRAHVSTFKFTKPVTDDGDTTIQQPPKKKWNAISMIVLLASANYEMLYAR